MSIVFLKFDKNYCPIVTYHWQLGTLFDLKVVFLFTERKKCGIIICNEFYEACFMILINKVTLSAAETEEYGALLARKIIDDKNLPRFVALYGDLGVGKTAFIRGFSSYAAPYANVKSPTFTLVNEYKGTHFPVFHFDMYRIEDEDSLYSIGFYDYLDRGICLTEWTENIEFALPDEYIKVTISKNDMENTDSRLITAELVGKE